MSVPIVGEEGVDVDGVRRDVAAGAGRQAVIDDYEAARASR